LTGRKGKRGGDRALWKAVDIDGNEKWGKDNKNWGKDYVETDAPTPFPTKVSWRTLIIVQCLSFKLTLLLNGSRVQPKRLLPLLPPKLRLTLQLLLLVMEKMTGGVDGSQMKKMTGGVDGSQMNGAVERKIGKRMTSGVDGSQMNGAVERKIFGLVTMVRSIVKSSF
jgi:hypothetical protein